VRPPSTFAAGTRRMADGESRHRPSSPQGTVAVPIAPSRDHRLLGGSPVKARRPGVPLQPVRTPVPQRFLFGAMANAALHLDWAGRGLAGPMVCDANDLAQAAAGAGIHGGTPVGEDPFGACTAALAEDFGHCGHQQAAPHLEVFPLPPWSTPGIGNLAHKGCAFPGQTCANLVQGSVEAKTGNLGRSTGTSSQRAVACSRGRRGFTAPSRCSAWAADSGRWAGPQSLPSS
jgi:hypothetical protein